MKVLPEKLVQQVTEMRWSDHVRGAVSKRERVYLGAEVEVLSTRVVSCRRRFRRCWQLKMVCRERVMSTRALPFEL